MIVGIGIDMIEVERVLDKISKGTAFKERIFSMREIEFCDTHAKHAENYAARFAAKEAFLKATGRGLALGFNLADIEVLNDSLGKPYIELNNSFRDEAVKNNWNKIHLSVSHLQTIACAVVIIEQ